MTAGKWIRFPEDDMRIAAGRLGISIQELKRREGNGFAHCTRCKQWKPFADFARNDKRRLGLDAICRQCKHEKYEVKKHVTRQS